MKGNLFEANWNLTKQALWDLKQLIQHLQTCTVPITMVVPHAPHYWVATDASKEGVGSFWLPSNIMPDQQPCAWHNHFNPDISSALIIYDNPKCTLCNSNLLPLATLHKNITAPLPTTAAHTLPLTTQLPRHGYTRVPPSQKIRQPSSYAS